MPTPAIQYNPGGGVVTLAFSFPPIQKPGPHDGNSDELIAARQDSITSSGLKQSVTERIDVFRTLQVEYVPFADEANWKNFMLYALTGGVFSYFPDRNLTTFDTWTLEDTSWPPSYNFRGFAKFKMRMRKVVGASGTVVVPVGNTQGGGGDGGGGTSAITTLPFTAPVDTDFSIPHNLLATPSGAIPVPTSDGLVRLQDPGWDATSIYLSASAPGVTGVVFVFA